MSGDTLRTTVIIQNPQGLHMRPASLFAQLASKYQSAVRVHKEGQDVNGKSPLELMMLGAEHGCELTLEVSGPDARDALDALAALLASPAFNEDTEAAKPPDGNPGA